MAVTAHPYASVKGIVPPRGFPCASEQKQPTSDLARLFQDPSSEAWNSLTELIKSYEGHAGLGGTIPLGPPPDNKYGFYNDPNGHCTRGFGHLVHMGACDPGEIVPWTLDNATAELHADMTQSVGALVNLLNRAGLSEMTEGQFAALVDILFHRGNNTVVAANIVTALLDGDLDRARDIITAGSSDRTRKLAEGMLFSNCFYAVGP